MKRPETAANFKRAMEERQQTHSPETRVSCAGAADTGQLTSCLFRPQRMPLPATGRIGLLGRDGGGKWHCGACSSFLPSALSRPRLVPESRLTWRRSAFGRGCHQSQRYVQPVADICRLGCK